MSTNRKPSSPKKPWYEDPVKKGFSILGGFIFVSGLGYSFCLVQKSLEYKIDQFQWQQDCNERVQAEAEKYKSQIQSCQDTRVNNLETIVKELQQKNAGKPKK